MGEKWHCFAIHIPWYAIRSENLKKMSSVQNETPYCTPYSSDRLAKSLVLFWFAVNSWRRILCGSVIIKKTSTILTANHQRKKCRGGGTLVQCQTCGNVPPGCRDGTGLVRTGIFCPEPEQSRSRRYILLGAGAGAVYHNKLCGWLRSLRLCSQLGDGVGKRRRSGLLRRNSAIGCGSCDRNETGAELDSKIGAANSK